MANTELGYCPRCECKTSFYHVEYDTWECEECGYETDDLYESEDAYSMFCEDRYSDEDDE